MPDWHLRCGDPDCRYRCGRPGCLEPGYHLGRFDKATQRWFHSWDCTVALDSRPPGASPPPARRPSPRHPAGPTQPRYSIAFSRSSHGPAGSSRRERQEWAEGLSAQSLKSGLLEARASKVVRLIAYLQIRNNWQPVPVAKSKGAGLLQWSESSWGRAVLAAEQLGWLRRDVRPGRVKGNRRGYNPGSIFTVVWDNLPRAEKPNYRDRPAYQVAARLYTNRIQQPGQNGVQPGHQGEKLNTEPGHGSQEPGHIPVFTTGSNLDPVRPNGRDVSAGAPIQPRPALAPSAPRGTVPTPKPPPQGGGGQPAEKGEPPPPAVVAEVKNAPWYRR